MSGTSCRLNILLEDSGTFISVPVPVRPLPFYYIQCFVMTPGDDPATPHHCHHQPEDILEIKLGQKRSPNLKPWEPLQDQIRLADDLFLYWDVNLDVL